VGLRIRCRSTSPEETKAIAGALAPGLVPGDVIALSGDLGAGKTCFVQGAAAALGVSERVTSPSFILVKEYEGRLPILHLDVYRLNNLQELTDLGYEEFLDPSWVVFVEWGDAIGPLLPASYLEIVIRRGSDEDRLIDLHARGTGWDRRLRELEAMFGTWIAGNGVGGGRG
jgi:tRNA threonylcarbamoyladenosine biosynthesis protein TsaE